MNRGKIVAEGVTHHVSDRAAIHYNPASGEWTGVVEYSFGENKYTNYSLSKVLTRLYEMGELSKNDLKWMAPMFDTTLIRNQ